MSSEDVLVVAVAAIAGVGGGACGTFITIWGLNKALDSWWGKDTRA